MLEDRPPLGQAALKFRPWCCIAPLRSEIFLLAGRCAPISSTFPAGTRPAHSVASTTGRLRNGLLHDWDAFLDDFHHHRPTDEDHLYVDFVRSASHGNGAGRMGNHRWQRLTEVRAGGARSVFHCEVPGQAAHSTHAGLPWPRFIRRRLGDRVHFWPFDGWEVPAGRSSAVVEVHPTRWAHLFPRDANRTRDQHDAYYIAAWLSQAARDGSLMTNMRPGLQPAEAAQARIKGWNLGVLG